MLQTTSSSSSSSSSSLSSSRSLLGPKWCRPTGSDALACYLVFGGWAVFMAAIYNERYGSTCDADLHQLPAGDARRDAIEDGLSIAAIETPMLVLFCALSALGWCACAVFRYHELDECARGVLILNLLVTASAAVVVTNRSFSGGGTRNCVCGDSVWVVDWARLLATLVPLRIAYSLTQSRARVAPADVAANSAV